MNYCTTTTAGNSFTIGNVPTKTGCGPEVFQTDKHPGGRRILTDDEMKEMWRRIDEKKKLDKQAKS